MGFTRSWIVTVRVRVDVIAARADGGMLCSGVVDLDVALLIVAFKFPHCFRLLPSLATPLAYVCLLLYIYTYIAATWNGGMAQAPGALHGLEDVEKWSGGVVKALHPWLARGGGNLAQSKESWVVERGREREPYAT